jgi:hypothetical protein
LLIDARLDTIDGQLADHRHPLAKILCRLPAE